MIDRQEVEALLAEAERGERPITDSRTMAALCRALCEWFGDPSGNGLDRGVPAVEEWFKRMKAALTAALAAQPGGSDNDR